MAEKTKPLFQTFLDDERLLAPKESRPPFLNFLDDMDDEEDNREDAETVAGYRPLPPATKEEEKGWEEKTEADRILASEWYGTAKEHDKEEAERKHRERQLQFVPDFIELRKQGKVLGDRAMALMKLTPEAASSPPEVIGDIDPHFLSLIVSSKTREEREKLVDSVMDKENLGFFNKTKDFKKKSGLDFDHFGMTKQQLKERKSGIQRRAAASRTKVSARKEPNIYQKWRSLESTRSLLGPEPSVFMELYKPMGNKIDRLGLIPAAFEPGEGAKKAGEYLKIAPKEGRGTAASTGAALWNTAVGLGEVVLGSPGGAATIGLGGALTKAGKIRQMYEAERVLALGETAFAIDLARNAAEHAPGLMNDLKNPDLSEQEKLEMVFGEAALLVFSGMSGAKAKKNFKKKYGVEPDKIKTREQALTAYEKFLDQAARDALDPKLRKTPKQIQEAQIESLIKEMQDKVDRGEFRVPRPKPLPRDLPRPVIKAAEGEPKPRSTDVITEKDIKKIKDCTPGRCFDNTLKAAMANPEGKIVEGTVAEVGAHSWLEIGDFVYDATQNVIVPKGKWYEMTGAKAENFLTAEEVMILRVKTKKGGPYTAEEIASVRKAEKPPTPVEAEVGLNWGSRKDAIYEPSVWEGKKLVKKSVEIEPEAVGLVPNQKEGAKPYRWTVKLTPSEFESLNPRGGKPETVKYIKSLAKKGADIAPPFMQVEWNAKKGAWQVVGHEGRSRTKAYRELVGDEPMTVDLILGRGLRRGDLTPEMKSGKLMPDTRADSKKLVTPAEWLPEAPKPPSKGYLEPPATALEAMKRDAAAKAAAAKAGEELKTLGEKMKDIYPRGVAEGQKEALPEAMERVIREQTLKELLKEQNVPALEEFMKGEKAPTSTEGLTKAPRTEEQMIKAAEKEAAEIDAAKALKDEAKIEEKASESTAEGEMLKEYIKNEKVRKFHKTIQRHMKGADAAEKARWAENPDSAYDVVPTSSWRRTIEKMSMEEIEADLSKNKAAIPQLGPELIVKSMLENRKAQLLKKRWRESKDPADWAEYESLVQELANPRTFAGQYIQAQRHFRAGDPIIEADVIAAAILNHNGPKLSKAERAKLVELIDKSMEAKERADKAAEEYWKDESNANWDGAIDALNKSEVATMNQIEFIANKTPKAVVDMLVATLQGNFLTPTTLAVNVAGNVAPLGPRALARGPARGLDMVEQFFMRDRRIAERNMLIDQQKKNPSAKVAARIEKLDKMLSPMEQIRLKPIEGTKEKFIGGWEGTGLPRVFEAIKKTREEGGNVMELLENFREGKKSTLGLDSAGSIILGEKLNQAMLIEVGEMDMSSMTPTLDAATASKRLLNTIRRKMGREVKGPESIKAISDLYEATFGLSPTIFFRLLAGGDIPFRNAELRRLIVEQAEIRKWSKEKTGRALERPSLIFKPKEWSALQFRAAQATFQHENRGTRWVQGVNKWVRGNSLKGEVAYLALRDMTPYQKTLLNVHAELLNFTPFGLADVIATANKDGFMSREAKISAGKVITGTTAMLLAERYLNNDIMSADQDPGMSETGDQRGDRYMTEETYHHGFINWDAALRDMKGEDTAWRPGDYISDARRMGQFGYLLLNGANYHRSLEMMPQEDRDKLSSSWDTLLKFTGESAQYSAKYAINQSFATGVRDKLRAVSRAMDADTMSDALKPIAGVLLRDAMTIAVPNTLGWWSKAGSPYKQTFKSDELSQTLKDEWAKKTGMWKEDYPILVDLWGTPLESMPRGTLYPGGIAKHKDTAEGKIDRLDRLMAVSFNIFRFKKSGTIMDPYSAEVYRLWRKFPKGNVVPPIASPKVTLDGVEYKLNRDQYVYYSVLTGRYRFDGAGKDVIRGPRAGEVGSREVEGGWGIRQFVNKSEPFSIGNVVYKDYMDVPDEVKAEEFRKIYRRANTKARSMFADWGRRKDTPKFDRVMKMFNIDPKNLPLTEDQIQKEPSGRAD